MNELQTARTPEIIGAEIRHITYNLKCTTLYGGIEIGRRLKEAKEKVPYGSFGDFLKNETEFSTSAAGRFMKLFEEYGGTLNSGGELFPTLGKVSVSNALRLLALPAEERESFAEENDVEHLSSRELDKLLVERNEALKRAEEETQAAEGAALKIAELQEDLDVARTREVNSEREIAQLKEQLSVAGQAAADARRVADELAAENEELRSRPIDVAVQIDEEAVKKAASDAKAEADAEWSRKLEAEERRRAEAVAPYEAKVAELEAEVKRRDEGIVPYKTKISEMEAAGRRSDEEIAALRKQLAMSGAEVTTFKLRFDSWQQAFNSMLDSLQAVPSENVDKLRAAVKAVLEGQVSRV